MGQMTRAAIVSEALELAGNPGLTLRANVWLNIWLQRVCAKWPWSFLQNAFGPYDLASGVAYLRFGGDTALVPVTTAKKIHVIRRAILRNPAGGSYISELELRSSANVRGSELASNAGRGVPTLAHVLPVDGVPFAWDLYFTPIPNRALALMLIAHFIPDDIDPTDAGDEAIPVYPLDETMVQAVYAAALKHQGDDRWEAEGTMLRRMVGEDRAAYCGAADMANPGLSPHRFRRGASRGWLSDP